MHDKVLIGYSGVLVRRPDAAVHRLSSSTGSAFVERVAMVRGSSSDRNKLKAKELPVRQIVG